MILDKNFEKQGICDQVEPWFETHYTIKGKTISVEWTEVLWNFLISVILDLPEDWKQLWASNFTDGESPFALPEANPYLASDFTLLELPAGLSPASNPSVPIQVENDNGIGLWFRQDSKFRIPKAVINFYLVSPIAMESPKRCVRPIWTVRQ